MSSASGGSDTPQRNWNNLPNARESIYKRWKDLRLIDDRKEVGEIWRGYGCL